MANHVSIDALRNAWTVWKGKKVGLSTSVGAQYATEKEWRSNSSKSEETEPKQKHA